jgi:hypothetical protein
MREINAPLSRAVANAAPCGFRADELAAREASSSFARVNVRKLNPMGNQAYSMPYLMPQSAYALYNSHEFSSGRNNGPRLVEPAKSAHFASLLNKQ